MNQNEDASSLNTLESYTHDSHNRLERMHEELEKLKKGIFKWFVPLFFLYVNIFKFNDVHITSCDFNKQQLMLLNMVIFRSLDFVNVKC